MTTTMVEEAVPGLQGDCKRGSRAIMALHPLGLAAGAMQVLTVPGRSSGVLRSIPGSLMTVDDKRYIVAGLDDANWVLNTRAAGRGMLRRGRTEEHVSPVELQSRIAPGSFMSFPG
jgi:hypothetical protein